MDKENLAFRQAMAKALVALILTTYQVLYFLTGEIKRADALTVSINLILPTPFTFQIFQIIIRKTWFIAKENLATVVALRN
jgi:hypothetical protein